MHVRILDCIIRDTVRLLVSLLVRVCTSPHTHHLSHTVASAAKAAMGKVARANNQQMKDTADSLMADNEEPSKKDD